MPALRQTDASLLLLRIGVAFALLYPAVSAWSDPFSWIGYFPEFMRGIVADSVLLHTFGALEIALALWILSGWRIFWPSLLVSAILVLIVILNMAEFQVLFRDLSIAAAALALALLSASHSKEL